MSEVAARQPLRDSVESVFSEILFRMESACADFEAAVFYDAEGETIDYHSYLDPFDTRLAAAHHGVIMSLAGAKARWLEMGGVKMMEISSPKCDIVTMVLGDGYFVTVIAGPGAIDDKVIDGFLEILVSLKEEAGI
jgi:predicted regulator of Ras-like GTPase activity (Roadblock/LC7/MglB family)